jgi:hypothetical protein
VLIDGTTSNSKSIHLRRVSMSIVGIPPSPPPDNTPNAQAALYVQGAAGVTDLHLTNCVFGGSASGPTSPMAGIYLGSASYVYITNCDVFNFRYGLMLEPISSEFKVHDVRIVNSAFDYSSNNACYLDGGKASSQIYNVIATGSWFCGSFADGVYVAAPASSAICSGITFFNCIIKGNWQNGISTAGGDHIQVYGSSLYANNQFSPGGEGPRAFSGIQLTNTSDVVASANVLTGFGGNLVGLPLPAQRYPINIEAGCDTILVSANDMNLTCLPPLIDETSALSCYIVNNSGFNPGGYDSAFTAPTATPVQNNTGQPITLFGSVSNGFGIGNSSDDITPVAGTQRMIRIDPGQWYETTAAPAGTFEAFAE